eukprot:Pgem_evm1s1858
MSACPWKTREKCTCNSTNKGYGCPPRNYVFHSKDTSLQGNFVGIGTVTNNENNFALRKYYLNKLGYKESDEKYKTFTALNEKNSKKFKNQLAVCGCHVKPEDAFLSKFGTYRMHETRNLYHRD